MTSWMNDFQILCFTISFHLIPYVQGKTLVKYPGDELQCLLIIYTLLKTPKTETLCIITTVYVLKLDMVLFYWKDPNTQKCLIKNDIIVKIRRRTKKKIYILFYPTCNWNVDRVNSNFNFVVLITAWFH